MVRAAGIEPASQAWEARVLPLNDARMEGARQLMVLDDIVNTIMQDEGYFFTIKINKIMNREKNTCVMCVKDVDVYHRRGHSLVVKLQPSKLIIRVRFPLPAPLITLILYLICPVLFI